MSVSHSWSGPVGFNLGGHLYTKMWEDADLDGTGMEGLIAEVLKRAPAWVADTLAAAEEVAVEEGKQEVRTMCLDCPFQA